MQDSNAPPSEFHTLVDTACSIIEAPHQHATSPIPGKDICILLGFITILHITIINDEFGGHFHPAQENER